MTERLCAPDEALRRVRRHRWTPNNIDPADLELVLNEFDRRGTVLTIIAEAHNRDDDRNGRCGECWQPSPCPTYLFADGWHPCDADWDDAPVGFKEAER